MSHITGRSKWVLVLLLAVTVSAFAQQIPQADAARLLSLSVGFRTQKATTLASLDADRRAEVEKLEAAASAANAGGKYGEAMKNLHHAQATMRGEAWTPLRQLRTSAILRVDRALPEPGQTVKMKIGQWYSVDEKLAGKLMATVLLLKTGGPGSTPEPVGAALKTQEVASAEWQASPLELSVTMPDVPDGNYTLVVVLKPADAAAGDDLGPAAPVRVVRGLSAKISALRERLKTAANPDPSAAYRVTMYDLASAGEINLGRADIAAEIAEANAILDDAARKEDPWAKRRGDARKAYLSNVDQTLQPYRAFVPSSYDGKTSFPLIIALHGMGGDENSMFEAYTVDGKNVVKTLAEKYGYLVACPKGRGPAAMYMGSAEKDVLDVLEEMKRTYMVDSTRVYLTGHSMGGYGTWSLAMSHPRLFAALGPIAGGGNTAGMEKIAHIPQIVIHGDNDKTVPVDRSREMVAAAKKLNVEMKYLEIPGGSHGGVAAPAFPEIFAWFNAHTTQKNTDRPVTDTQPRR